MGKTTKEKKPASPKKTTQKKTKKTSKSAKTSLSLAQRAFLQYYTAYFGNITAACKKAGVCRQTFYDWKKNAAFAAELEAAEVEERLVDSAEVALIERVKARDLKAIIYVLDSKGASRGWGRNATLNVATKTPIVIQPGDVGFFDNLNADEKNED